MAKELFYEEQKQRAWWLKLLMIGATLLGVGPLTYGLYSQLVMGIPFGDEPMSKNALIFTTAVIYLIMIGVNFIVFKSRMVTVVDTEAVRFSYWPLINKPRVIRKEMIEKYVIRNYRALSEYGGYGIKRRRLRYLLKDQNRPQNEERRGMRRMLRRSMSYTMAGNKGLQLYLKNGQELLIGTQRPDALERAMKKMMEQEAYTHSVNN